MREFREIGKVLAVLIAEQDSYTYVDKLGYAPSRDLAVYYLKEALRDLHSLLRKGKFENKGAEELLKNIDFSQIEAELERFQKISDRKELREKTSSIAAHALALSARLKSKWEGGWYYGRCLSFY